MMLGHSNPTVHVPPWPALDDPTAAEGEYSPIHLQEAISALQQYFPSESDPDAPVDAYSCDHFRMFEFKIRRCARGRSHDWTECPYAHPGEKARRRDPRRHHYSGTACPEFRKGGCKKGDACEHAHGVFECWLHPARYRTQACKDGTACRRRVCFFAHSPDQLRVLAPSQSPRSVNSGDSYHVSPPESPPVSPPLSRSLEIVSSLRNLQLGSAWNMRVGSGSPIYGSPRGPVAVTRPGFLSLPTTPTQTFTRRVGGNPDFWDTVCEEEPVMERVESGRNLRVRMFEKLSKENPLERVDPEESPDLGWVSELVK